MEQTIERCCGLDVHKATGAACLRISEGGSVQEMVRTFGTTTHELLVLRDWLVLHDANIKLRSVATDILGVSGRARLSALVAGTTDAETLAELACGKLRKNLPRTRPRLLQPLRRRTN